MRYRLTVLEPLPGHKIAIPRAINRHGWVVGYSQKSAHDDEVPTLWVSGQPRQLISPDLGQPLDINDKNETLFGSHILTASGKQINLSPKNARYAATAINNKSRVVGIEIRRTHAWGVSHYSNGRWNLLELFEKEGSDTRDINDEGTVAGWYAGEKSGGLGGDACIWVNGHRRLLGCLPGRDSGHALSINSQNQVVGFCYEATQHVRHGKRLYRAFFWHRGRIRDLGALSPDAESGATGINDSGVITGRSNRQRSRNNEPGPGKPTYAVLWHRFKIIDLNTLVTPPPGYRLDTASDINNHNQIIGTMIDSKKQEKGYLLTPY